jgi:hypothetical protein
VKKDLRVQVFRVQRFRGSEPRTVNPEPRTVLWCAGDLFYKKGGTSAIWILGTNNKCRFE